MTTLPERSSHMWITRCAWICLQESAEMSHIGGQRRNATPWKLKGIQTFFLDIMTFKSVLVSCLQLAQQGKATILPFFIKCLDFRCGTVDKIVDTPVLEEVCRDTTKQLCEDVSRNIVISVPREVVKQKCSPVTQIRCSPVKIQVPERQCHTELKPVCTIAEKQKCFDVKREVYT